MTSNRPFLSNFLTAFRAHGSILPKAGPSLSSTTASTTGATVWSAAAASYTGPTQQTQQIGTLSSPRAISDPRKGGAANPSASPGPFSPPLQHNVTPLTHGTRPRSTSPGAENMHGPDPKRPGTQHISSPSTAAVGIPSSANRRRGSDSSSEGGFRDVATSRGGEKWYIGGRTAGGEERYYKLSMVRRERSADRLSTDRLSL
ncbi:hypothetical protein K461DRAFT_290952 [Myriangium duriaei CBS 260.36]|uniref:Uncharacterized protein n=1 Tax=Myriangium duriaei CBS 260.36 TaxID=1168546 RepID=A0A9P4MK73_9PEZI|nr:hypothetical protein K461DRAFT_290952 [Myriangium duriaei CBS 260.36]